MKQQPRSGQENLYLRFQQQVQQHPDNKALTDGTQTLSYQELAQKVALAANQLYAKGVRAGDNVALLLPRNCDLITQVLATLELGACYVPIDPDYPVDRINWIIKNSDPKVLVTESSLAKTLDLTVATPNSQVQHLLVDQVSSDDKTPAPHIPQPHREDSFAYIIFTSGTTGNPKGVAVGHKQVLSLLDAALPLLEADNKDVWSLFHSLAFDFSVWELWGALTTGACLAVVPKSIAWAPEAFAQFLRQQQVTILNQTPSAFYALIDAELNLQQQEQKLALRKVIFGGEALNLQKLKRWWQLYQCDSPTLVNMYGITETTVHVTWQPISSEMEVTDQSPIGLALPSLEVLLLDEQLQPVAEGEVGEIYVAGQQLAYGYIGRPDLTATRFIASPYHPGQRLYRSGDLATRQNGQLYYQGRADRQLKIRGFRIEPAEVEAVLESHPAVQRAVVIAKPAAESELPDGLLAFLLASDNAQPPSATELRSFASEHLPAHYLPADYIFVQQLPLTVNGKLDQKQLISQWHNRQANTLSANQRRLQLLRAKQLNSQKKSPA